MENHKYLDTIEGINKQIGLLDKEINLLRLLAVSQIGKDALVLLHNKGDKLKTNLEEFANKSKKLQVEYDEQLARQVSVDRLVAKLKKNMETLERQLEDEQGNTQQLRAQIRELNEQNNKLTKAIKKEEQKKTKNIYQSQLSAEEMYEIGEQMYEKGDYSEAVKRYRKAAEQGYARAQTNLGWLYVIGEAVPQNNIEAIKWFRKAASQGDKIAQYNLGLMYLNGKGVPQDDLEAVKWFRKAAEQGETSAQNDLGVMYQYGRGVLQNDSEAVKWYRKAAAQGETLSQIKLEQLNESW